MWKYFVYYPLPFFLIKKLTKKSTCPYLWSGGCEIMPIIMIAAPSRHKMAQFPSLPKINELASNIKIMRWPIGLKQHLFLNGSRENFLAHFFQGRHSKNTDVWIGKCLFFESYSFSSYCIDGDYYTCFLRVNNT